MGLAGKAAKLLLTALFGLWLAAYLLREAVAMLAPLWPAFAVFGGLLVLLSFLARYYRR